MSITISPDATWEVPMSTSVEGWFQPPLAEDRTIGLVNNWIEAAIGLLTIVVFLSFVIGTASLFVLGAFYLKPLVTALPFLSQFFGL
jgi:hypothetical protein